MHLVSHFSGSLSLRSHGNVIGVKTFLVQKYREATKAYWNQVSNVVIRNMMSTQIISQYHVLYFNIVEIKPVEDSLYNKHIICDVVLAFII